MTHLEFPWPIPFRFWACLVIPVLKMQKKKSHFSPCQIWSLLELPGISIIGYRKVEAPKVPEKLQNFMKYRCNKFSNNLCSSGCTCQIQLMCTQSFSFQSDKHSYSAPPQPSLFSNPVEINAHISLDHLQLFISSSEHRPSTHVCTYVCMCAQTQCTRTYVRYSSFFWIQKPSEGNTITILMSCTTIHKRLSIS